MQKQPLYIALIVIIILGLIFILYRASKPALAPTTGSTATSTASTTPIIPITGTTTTVTLPNGAVVTVTPHPATGGLTQEQMMAQLQAGINKKEAGDYQGAAQAWLNIIKVAPANYIAYADLGDLYMNFLKDYAKAETYYSDAIKYDPKNPDYYRNLYTLYTWQGNTAAASTTLAAGIKATSGDTSLIALEQQFQATQH